MDARLSREQRQMQDSVRDLIESKGGINLAREFMDGNDVLLDELWEEFAALDYCAITVPTEYGGLGGGVVSLVALFEELGRYAVPSPLPETAGVAVPLIAEHGTDEQKETVLPAVAEGDLVVSLAVYDDGDEPLPAAIQQNGVRSGDGVAFSGTKTLVPYAEHADYVLLADRAGDASGYEGISLFLVEADEATSVRELESVDRTRPTYAMTFDEVKLGDDDRLGGVGDGGRLLEAAMDRYTLAMAAMLVGGADRAVDLSSEYATEREQYGQPIGKFQAVKHRIVDMWVDMQAGRSLVYKAAWAVDQGDGERSHAVPAVKTFVADRVQRVFRDDIWNHGGMGFTWDHDAHIYLKQAEAWRNLFGTPSAHADRLLDARLESGLPEVE